MDITSWFQLAAICFLGAISPGPSLALVIGNTLAGGRIYGVVTSLGHASGIGWWALLTAVGVAEVMADKSGMLLALQSSGACLLGYIGFRTMIARNGLSLQQIDARSTSYGILLKGAGEGFLISLLNPKIAVFFLAIFSHIINTPPITIAVAITQNTLVSAIALKIESKEKTTFITTIKVITVPTELFFRSPACCSSNEIICHISLVAVYMINTPPKRTIRL